MKKNIKNIRKKIDETDRCIVRLLQARAKLALEIGHLKNKEGSAAYVPRREKEVMENVFAAAADKSGGKKSFLNKETLENIYSEIIGACRNLEKPEKIAFLGPEGTFTHQAAVKKFGSSCFFKPCASAGAVLKEIENARADFGIVPVENSNEGSVNETLDNLAGSDLCICAEINLKIEQCLLAKNMHKKIKKIYSHPHALAQCGAWLNANYPSVKLMETSSTAEAAKKAAKENNCAAIASFTTAKIWKLCVVEKGIQSRGQNYTRFLIIGKNSPPPSGKDKTSVVFMGKDEAGTLYRLLAIFNKHKINLKRIESRPTKKKAWEYLFFADFQGHALDKKSAAMLEELKKSCVFVKVLGSYPEQ